MGKKCITTMREEKKEEKTRPKHKKSFYKAIKTREN
jgi:hypothetical protein